MPPFVIRIFAFAVLLIYIIVCAIWRRPRTEAGKLTLKLCLLNSVCWVIVLLLDTKGHPPPVLIIGFILWLLNLPLLIATITALWVAFRNGQEDFSYLVGTTNYVALNIVALWIVPVIALLSLM